VRLVKGNRDYAAADGIPNVNERRRRHAGEPVDRV
jgi:hypothetical protein